MDNTFTDWLNTELNARNWSYADLSKKSGISQAHISKVFSGQRGVGIEFCEKIALALDLPLELVLQKTGILPTRLTGDDPDFKIVEHLYYLLNKQDRQLLIDFAKMLKGKDDKRTKEDLGGSK